jgi:aminoglycoside phosphotransferase (APT) family kinase protein
VHAALVAGMPTQVGSTIVHGDYRLDNCMVGHDGRLLAVLDWELCTLGDPLADVGLLIVYSPGADEPGAAGIPAATSLPGFPTRAQLLDRYAEKSERDLSGIEYYVAFGYWKLACIVEGVYARYLGGAMGQGDPALVQVLGDHAVETARRAAAVLERGI